jgi:glucosylglycerate hydrolase
MVARATEVLRENDMGGWTRASPTLYPHQWSWDTAFIALGLARIDPPRAAAELLNLLRHQWANGKIPHIVYNPGAPPDSYFPGAEHWSSAGVFPKAPPAPPYTSALCQPPMHAIAARHVWGIMEEGGEDPEAFVREAYPGLYNWHRYLMTERDPERSGLVTIFHPWESGTDNSPRWDRALAAVEVGEMAPYRRLDLQHVEDPRERPTDHEYDRYIWLVELVKRARADASVLYAADHPFRVKDVLASSILVAANEALLEMAALVGAPREKTEEIIGWIDRGRAGLDGCWDPVFELYLDQDVRSGGPLRARTIAGFAPVVAGGLEPERLASLLETLYSRVFAGHPALWRPLPPSASPTTTGFRPRSYWRGPVWPVMTWLLWWSLRRAGEIGMAHDLRAYGLEQLAVSGFAEYFDPFTGNALGSGAQSWTAAVALDWLAEEG